jgi:phosphoglycolate phosphatase
MTTHNTFSTLLFDLDGTLVDTSRDIAFALNAALADAGVSPISDNDCMRYVGRGLRNALGCALRDAGRTIDEHDMDTLLGILQKTYEEHPFDRARVYPGIDRILEKSVAGGYKLGVLSNKDDLLVKRIVGELFGQIPFIMVQGATGHIPLKPDPTSAHMFARFAGCPAGSVLLVGDTEVDYQTALAAGMQIAVVTWGFRSRAVLESAGCEPLFDTVEELETEVFPWQ